MGNTQIKCKEVIKPKRRIPTTEHKFTITIGRIYKYYQRMKYNEPKFILGESEWISFHNRTFHKLFRYRLLPVQLMEKTLIAPIGSLKIAISDSIKLIIMEFDEYNKKGAINNIVVYQLNLFSSVEGDVLITSVAGRNEGGSEQLFIGFSDGGLVFYELRLKVKRIIGGERGRIEDVKYIDKTQIVSICGNRKLTIWDYHTCCSLVSIDSLPSLSWEVLPFRLHFADNWAFGVSSWDSKQGLTIYDPYQIYKIQHCIDAQEVNTLAFLHPNKLLIGTNTGNISCYDIFGTLYWNLFLGNQLPYGTDINTQLYPVKSLITLQNNYILALVQHRILGIDLNHTQNYNILYKNSTTLKVFAIMLQQPI